MVQMVSQFLSGLDYKFNIKRLPHVNFFVQQFSLPTVGVDDIRQGTPFSPYFVPGDIINYGEFSLTFKVDEDMENYMEIYDWMVSMTAPRTFSEFGKINNEKVDWVSDASLIIMSSQKNPSILFNFTNCFPTSLGSVTFDTTQESVQYLETTVDFRFDTYSVRRLRKD